MDEREVHELLANAAGEVVASGDLAARAERRYRRRRNRTQALVAAVVVVLIGSSVAAAAVVAGSNDSPTTVSPVPTTVASPTTAPTAGTALDPSLVTALSFVDANVGFGLIYSSDGPTSAVVRSDDGGRHWRRVGSLIEAEAGVHFENASDGVAWGTGPLEVTTDGGAHWKAADGPVDNSLAWSSGRLWALTPCVQSTPCGSRPVLVSDDRGVTWQPTAPLQLGLGGATLLAISRSTAYIVEPATDAEQGPWQIAITADGGASWTYRPVPCLESTTSVSLAFNGRVLLLACVGQPMAAPRLKFEYASSDDGTTWRQTARTYFPGESVDLTSVASVFIEDSGSSTLFSSTDDGQVWLPTLQTAGPTRTDVVPGVGMWAAVDNSGVWFSPNGIHWEQRFRSPRASAPPTTVTPPPTRPTPTTTVPARFNTASLSSLTFVDANVGYALRGEDLMRTQDGGRAWQSVDGVGLRLRTPVYVENAVHFENASNGVAWGDGTTEFTTDGGRHWRAADGGPTDVVMGWAGGRLWGYVPCHRSAPCGVRPLVISDNGGRTWRRVGSTRVGGLLAVSRSTAYLLRPVSDEEFAPSELAVTHDGGSTWETKPVPCAPGEDRFLAANGSSLLVACPGNPYSGALQDKPSFVSTDEGASWTPGAKTMGSGNVAQVTSMGSTYLAALGRGGAAISTDNGHSWKAPGFPLSPAEGGVTFATLPAVGVWAAEGGAGGIWFSTDGVHWDLRAAPISPY